MKKIDWKFSFTLVELKIKFKNKEIKKAGWAISGKSNEEKAMEKVSECNFGHKNQHTSA